MKLNLKRLAAAALCVVMAAMNTAPAMAATGVYKTVTTVSTTSSSKTISQLTSSDSYKVRDAIVDLNDSSVNRMASEHFQIIWGNSNSSSTTVNDSFIKGNLVNLENIRTFYIEQLGMQDICYSMTGSLSGKYKTNVYVSNTGLNGFEDDWAYMATDSQGFAYLFLNPDAMRVDPPSWVVPHELGHVFTYHQGGTVDYAWYEATANWFRDQYLGSKYYAYNGKTYGPDSDFFAPYMMNGDYYVPHMLNWYDTWPIFLYISENPDNINGLGMSFMQRFFADAGSYSSMYEKIEKLSGVSIKTILGNMTKRLAVMDFSRQSHYLEELNNTLNNDSSAYGKIYTTLGSKDSSGYQSVSSSDAPMQTGFNIIPLDVDFSKARIEVDFVSTSGGDFRTSIVTATADNTARYSDMICGNGSAAISLRGDEVKAYLVVCATPDNLKGYQVDWNSSASDSDTRYKYKVRITATNGEATTETTTKTTTTKETTTKATTVKTTTEATTETTTKTLSGSAAQMGTYVFGTNASGGDFNITSKAAAVLGNVSFRFRDVKSDGARTRKNDGYTNVYLTLAADTNVTLISSGKGMVASSANGAEYAFAKGTATVTLPAGTYTIQGASTSSNSTLSEMILSSAGAAITTTKAATTTTEAATETTTAAQSYGLNAGTYSAADMLSGSADFKVSGSTSDVQVKINESGYVQFTVGDGARVDVTYKCGSSNNSKTAGISLNGQTSAALYGGQSPETLTVWGLGSGTYRITAFQSGGTTAQINSVTISY